MDHALMHDDPILNKTEFGWNEKPPAKQDVKNAYPSPLGVRGDANAAAPGADAMSDDTVVVPDPSDMRVGVVRKPYEHDLTSQWGSVKKGTTGLGGVTAGTNRSTNDVALGG